MKCGIIGLPNVGKSTLFNCLTSLKAPAENYPFCTVNPNIGRVNVPDPRLDILTQIFKPQKTTPACIEFVDIAGLIPGAHKGEGLGNRFLSHIREVDALLHVVRVFENKDIAHFVTNPTSEKKDLSGHNQTENPQQKSPPTSRAVDPLRDIELIETELILADAETLQKKKEKLTKLSKSISKSTNAKELKIELSLIEKLQDLLLNKTQPANQYAPTKEEEPFWKNLCLLTAKPCLYVCNTGESSSEGAVLPPPTTTDPPKKNDTPPPQTHKEADPATTAITTAQHIHNLKNQYGADKVLTLCATLEVQIAELSSLQEKQEFLRVMGLQEPGLNCLIRYSYQLLDLITFFTAGKKEVRAWTLSKGASAPTAGGKIHSDFQKGFICAEVYSFEDLKSLRSESAVKTAGKYRQEGKDYIVQDGDIILFRFNV